MARKGETWKAYGDESSGYHLFPFRTEKLKPRAPMVLRLKRGRVGRRRPQRATGRSPFFLLSVRVRPDAPLFYPGCHGDSEGARNTGSLSSGISPRYWMEGVWIYEKSPATTVTRLCMHCNFLFFLCLLLHLLKCFNNGRQSAEGRHFFPFIPSFYCRAAKVGFTTFQ